MCYNGCIKAEADRRYIMNNTKWNSAMKSQVKGCIRKILDKNGYGEADDLVVNDICDLFYEGGCGSHDILTKLTLDYVSR
jgi:hypothetical protein